MIPEMQKIWFRCLAEATDLEAVGALRAQAWTARLRTPEWEAALNEKREQLRSEDAVRLDERIRVLREVRNKAARADAACHETPGKKGDPYSWGFGGSMIVAFLSWKLGEARRAAGQPR
jgi:hypothetical protein